MKMVIGMQHPLLIIYILFFIKNSFAYSDISPTGDGYNALKCPDGSLALAKGLHACCENPPFVFCVLCVHLTRGHDMTCTMDCNGTIRKVYPYCLDCQCTPPRPTVKSEEDDGKNYRGCPFMNRHKKHEEL
jgi:hypothetical protein